MADELTAFITARLDEDEQIARDAESACWHVDYCDDRGEPFHGRHDPSRVLREAEAKRAILALHVPLDDCEPQQCVICLEYVPCRTLRHHAAVWSDHPGYRLEWKP